MEKTRHIGKADIDRIISESIDSVLKEKRGENTCLNESMKFNGNYIPVDREKQGFGVFVRLKG